MTHKERNKRYIESHREEIKERGRIYRATHKAQIAAKSKRNYANQPKGTCVDCGCQTCAAKHTLCRSCYRKRLQGDRVGKPSLSKMSKEERDAYFLEYNANHKDQIAAKGLKHRMLHKSEILDRNRRYRAEHKEEYKVHCANRRARIKNSHGSHTPKEWEELKASYLNRCAYCGERSDNLTQDHIVPVKRGGSNNIDNIVPACGLCNSKKGAKMLLKFLYDQRLLGVMVWYPVA